MFVSVTLGPPGAFFTQCVFVCVLVCISYSVCKLATIYLYLKNLVAKRYRTVNAN